MQRKTRNILIITILAIFAVLLSVFLLMKNKEYPALELPLDSLNTENIYQFNEIAWGMSVSEVNQRLPHKFLKDTVRTSLPAAFTYYTSATLGVGLYN